MKFFRTRATVAAAEASTPIDRRKLVLGAGVAGAAAVVATQAFRPEVSVVAEVDPAKAPAGASEGYQLTQHVMRYYETAKV